MKRVLKVVLIVAGVAVLLVVLAFVVWGLTPLGPGDAALVAMASDANVTVSHEGDALVFVPTGQGPTAGFILYPGGHVDYRSYAPVARMLAAHGYLVAIIEMPLSLALLGIDRADSMIAAHPEVHAWVIGGHSLGGTAAASYARTHADRIGGIAFWASYPANGDDLSATAMKGLSTYGSNDGVLNRENLNATLGLLPNGTAVRVIEGGNHAQFGDYGPQPGDGTATITPAEQQSEAADLTSGLLRAVAGA